MTTSSSKCLCQATQVEKKETDEDKVGKEKEKHEDKEGEVTVEKEEEKDKEKKEEEEESGPEEGSRGEKDEKTAEEEAKAPRVPRRPKTMQIKVTLLDDTLYECELDVSSHTHAHTPRAYGIHIHLCEDQRFECYYTCGDQRPRRMCF